MDVKIDEEIIITAKITNTGNCYGGEVVQLYVKAPYSDVFKPEKELKGFTKIYLKEGESKEIIIKLNKKELGYYNIKEKRNVLESGYYEFQLCCNSEEVKLSKKIIIEGEDIISPYDKETFLLYDKTPQKISDEIFERMSGIKIPSIKPLKPITLESRFSDLKQTFIGKILYNAVLSVAKKDMKEALKLPEGLQRDNKIKGAIFLKRILDSNSIITMSMSAGNSCPYHFAKGFVDLANGHIFKGIKDFCSPVKVAPLPKNQIKQDKE